MMGGTRTGLRANVVYAHDIAMAAASFFLSLYMRVGDAMVYYGRDRVFLAALLFTAIAAGVFRLMGLYRGVWRYASINDLLAITRAATVVVLVFLLVLFLWTRLEILPRSVPFINWFVLMALLGGPRFLYRALKDRRFDFNVDEVRHRRVPVLLAGAEDGAEMFIRSVSREPDPGYRVVGILAETRGRVGRRIHGIEVAGTLDDIETVVEGLGPLNRPRRVILTKDTIAGARVRALLDKSSELGMSLARLPRLTDFKDGVSDKIEVRPVAVEDLLGRPQTPLDRDAMEALIAGRRTLITGAGGNIGSELVRQISELGPAEIVLLDHSESSLYAIDLETSERAPDLRRHAVIADVRDRGRIDHVFTRHRPELVFHAAAMKHVPLAERNLFEAVTTNVIGTASVADAAVASGASAVVLISTDKAVNPTNVMGATKRIAERYCQSLDLRPGNDDKTRFVTVRFGNVLGSTGSVVPLFQSQLERGGPLTVTHADMKRYFMTTREAVELVLQASAMGSQGPETDGKIFVLDMGEPVRILDLARQMIRLAGLEPETDVEIRFIGPRPGEKLSEEIFHMGEPLVATGCPGILLAAPRAADRVEMGRAIERLGDACRRCDAGAVMDIIRELVPEFRTGDAGPSPEPAEVTAAVRAASE